MDRLSTYVIFCDDVRQEVGNKKSYIGVYTEELYVPTLPTLLPKFYMVTTIACRVSDIPKQLAVVFEIADEVMDRTEFTGKQLEEWCVEATKSLSEESAEANSDQPPKARLMMEYLVSPFVIKKEGRIVAYVETDVGRARIGSLKIVRKDSEPSTALDVFEKESRQQVEAS